MTGWGNIAHANTWQIMLIPEQINQTAAADSELSNNVLIREGISSKLVQQLDKIVSHERVFANCDMNLCGQASTQEVLNEVARQAPDVELVLFYGVFQSDSNSSLRATLIDPLSFQQYASFDLTLLSSEIGVIERAQLKSAALDIGRIISQGLREVEKRNQFDLRLKGFSIDEVAPFSTFVLSTTLDTKLTLTKSEKQSSTLSAYLPIMETHFTVSSGLTQSQFHQLLLVFFQDQGIDTVNEYNRESNEFIVSRIGNPYTPSLVSSVLIFIVCAGVLVLLIRRQMFHYQLESYAQRKSVEKWLQVYQKAKAPWYMLQKKWSNQSSYWQRLQRESADLETQAKLFFDAGDINTAKLFISKALNLNADAAVARALIDKISTQESSQQALSEKEQWVRNKVAKAMNNYRTNQPIKALRQAYQALNESAEEKKLKRQHKAIRRLIQKINVDFVQSHDSFELTDLTRQDTCVVSCLGEIEIGRYLDAEQYHARSEQIEQSMRFFINHKGLSRVGKHCKLIAAADGFYVQDSGSKNGTFLQGKKVSKDSRNLLHDQDILYLGANSELSAVKLEVNVDSTHTLLQINVGKQLRHTLDMAELARVWPDYTHAMRSSLVLTHTDFVLAIDNQNENLKIVSLNDVQSAPQLIALVRIWLGQTASIAPMLELSKIDQEGLYCNEEKLYGIVPLILPCEIKYKEQHVRIDEYLQLRHRRQNEQSYHQLQFPRIDNP